MFKFDGVAGDPRQYVAEMEAMLRLIADLKKSSKKFLNKKRDGHQQSNTDDGDDRDDGDDGDAGDDDDSDEVSMMMT